MTKLYAVNCAPLKNETTLSTVLPRLDNTRTARINRLQPAQKRAQCAAAGLLLTHLFGEDGRPPTLTHGSRGKPYLADNRAFFSLSHSGEWVFCAVSDSEVGMDAQGKSLYSEKIAARQFTAAERAWVNGDATRFTRLWACKEAYLKFTGFGLVLPMSSFTVPTPADGRDEDNHCVWKEYTLENTHIAVCIGEETAFAPLTILTLDDML